MAKEKEIDDLDRKILALLMENAKRPYTEIAQQLYVSGGTIHVRMNKMIEAGIVRGYGLQVDPEKLGYDVTAFLGIYLEKSSMYPTVAKALKNITEVTGAHYTTGLYNIFIKVVCRDTNHLRDVLHQLQEIDGIQRTETFISLEESINRPINVLDRAEEEEMVS
jgi:Lrp/AsnC family transcriptional regulator, regulator for asnA, asnC and gidA